MMSCAIPQIDRPVMRNTRRRPIFEMTLLFIITASTPTEVRMQEFMNGLPTFAIYFVISIVPMFAAPERVEIRTWKKYVPYAITNIAPDAA
jgi:hypothetical protein